MTLLAMIVLLPIIPSFMLFKLLPNNVIVNGPFKGLTVNLSGSFAGFFLIFITLIPIRGSFQNSYERWSVKGRVVMPDGSAQQYIDSKYVTFSVPALRSDADGNFSFTFLRTSDHVYDYPHLHINFPGFQPVTYFLGPAKQNIWKERQPTVESGNVIDIGDVQLVPLSQGSTPNPYSALGLTGKP